MMTMPQLAIGILAGIGALTVFCAAIIVIGLIADAFGRRRGIAPADPATIAHDHRD